MHAAVETGLVRSLARPGGNVTGVESLAPELDANRLELIKEIVPKLTRLGHLYNPDDQAGQATLASVREAARKLGVRVVPLPVKRIDEIDGVISGVSAGSIDALLTSTDEVTAWRAQQIAAFASKHRSIEQVTRFEMLINMTTAKTLGITIPRAVLVRGDEVIP